jgi:hypothetical protein
MNARVAPSPRPSRWQSFCPIQRLQTEHGEDLNKVEETARQRARKPHRAGSSRDAAHADLREYALNTLLLPGR